MITPLTLGIDIGGTNSDCAVLNAQQKIVFRTKTATTPDIISGIDTVLAATLSQPLMAQQNVKAIFISSTHATNALLEARNLLRVGVIRIASNNPASIPSGLGWPEPLQAALSLKTVTIAGGHEIDGSAMAPLTQQSVLSAADELVKQGAESLVVIGVFSPLYPNHELQAAELITKEYPLLPVTCSKDVGGSGFIERENAAILNAALKKCVKDGFNKIEALCTAKGFLCPVFAVQNNGSTISLEQACSFPITLLAAGPTNSCMGAAHLSELKECVIVDIGGTSTDIGLIKKGSARRTFGNSSIAGVSLNFSMPDVLSLALGGGSIVAIEPTGISTIGPCSVGAELLQKAYCGGGNSLTLTDCALRSGHCTTLTPLVLAPLEQMQACAVMEQAIQTIAHAVERFACLEKESPVVFVGGGSALFPQDLLQAYFPHRRVIKPFDAEVANAVGAACALVSGIVDEIVSFDANPSDKNRDAIIAAMCNKATDRALENGADPATVSIQDIIILPYAYVSQSTARIRVCAVGKLKHS